MMAGVHATAGPLPPPPRASNISVSSPPPPRPPRLRSPSPAQIKGGLEAVKQSLQLPESVTAALSKSPNHSIANPNQPDDNGEDQTSGKEAKEYIIFSSIFRSLILPFVLALVHKCPMQRVSIDERVQLYRALSLPSNRLQSLNSLHRVLPSLRYLS